MLEQQLFLLLDKPDSKGHRLRGFFGVFLLVSRAVAIRFAASGFSVMIKVYFCNRFLTTADHSEMDCQLKALQYMQASWSLKFLATNKYAIHDVNMRGI